MARAYADAGTDNSTDPGPAARLRRRLSGATPHTGREGASGPSRKTKIMQIFSTRKRPLELQNGGLVERNDFIELSLRADGSLPPAELRQNQELGKFKLASGEARLKARTKQDDLMAEARRIRRRVRQTEEDFANGKDFSEEAEVGGSDNSSSSSSSSSSGGSRQ